MVESKKAIILSKRPAGHFAKDTAEYLRGIGLSVEVSDYKRAEPPEKTLVFAERYFIRGDNKTLVESKLSLPKSDKKLMAGSRIPSGYHRMLNALVLLENTVFILQSGLSYNIEDLLDTASGSEPLGVEGILYLSGGHYSAFTRNRMGDAKNVLESYTPTSPTPARLK